MAKVAYLCSSIQLQDQLLSDFPEAGYLKGRSNYECLQSGLTATECTHDSEKDPCDFRRNCPYQLQKIDLLMNDVHILNYHYFLYAANFTESFSEYDLVICDEADVLENILSSFISFTITRRNIKRYGIHKPKLVTNTSANVKEVWADWIKEAKNKIFAKTLEKQGYKTGTPEYKIANKKRQALIQNLNNLQSNIDPANWIFDEDSFGFTFKPVWVTPVMFDRYFGDHGRKFVFMSGSLPDETTFCKILGLYPADVDYFATPSDFPVENRLVKKCFVGGMGKKKQESTLPKIVSKIDEILDRHRDEKVLIHTVSYKLQEELYNTLKYTKMITHNKSNFFEKLDEWKKSCYNNVFISPVASRGVDLPDDLCRVQVIVKAPFLNLGDKLTQLRVYGSGEFGRRWYRSMCCQEIIQMVGRGVRHKGDKCITYVLDDDACRLLGDKEMFKDWFLEAVTYE